MKNLFRPFTALLLGLLLASCGRAGRMRHMLEQAEWMNLHDSAFTSDSVGRALVRYHDHWWHPADLRLRAYYMLGCAYRDLGEAPAAIHYYNIATEKADTAHADSATYATLFRVYGQMAMVYGQQNMPYEQLEAWKIFRHYAWLAKDTLNYIIGCEHITIPYYLLNDSINVYKTTEEARTLYLKYGQKERAAGVYPTAIYVSLLNANYTRARQYMDIFEHDSGLFDEQGNIKTGREHYYNSKGLYYRGIGNLDSAEWHFRKLQKYGYFLEATEGLLSLFEDKREADSIIKYFSSYKQALLQWRSTQQAEAIAKYSAMYDYTRVQNIAKEKEKDARIAHLLIGLLLLTIVAIGLCVNLVYNRIQKQRLEKELEYRRLVEEHTQIRKKYQQQDEMLQAYRNNVAEKEEKLKSEEICSDFRNRVIHQSFMNMPTKREWEKLIRTYRSYMPHIYARMKVGKLSNRELCSCILTHLDFSGGDLATLLGTSANIVSNAKSSANLKLFADKSATTLMQNLKKCAYFE